MTDNADLIEQQVDDIARLTAEVEQKDKTIADMHHSHSDDLMEYRSAVEYRDQDIARLTAKVERLREAIQEAVGYEAARLTHEYGIERDLAAPDGLTPKWYMIASAALTPQEPTT